MNDFRVNGRKYHTIVSGDICYDLWRANGLTDSEFYALNPGIVCDNLQIGQVVCVGGTAGGDGNGDEKRVVGYYTGWASREITDAQLLKMNTVIFAFPVMSSDGTIHLEDGQSRNRFETLKTKAAQVNPSMNVLVAIGGWTNSQYFSAVASNSQSRSTFVNSVTEFIQSNGIDGVDIDWEHPVTGGNSQGKPEDKENFVSLLRELRAGLTSLQSQQGRENPYVLTMAAAADKWILSQAYDLPAIIPYLDFINVMTYDYYGLWDGVTGPSSPLYNAAPAVHSETKNIDWTINYYLSNGVSADKLNIGVPFYGSFWENVGEALGSDPMFRQSEKVNGVYAGGSIAWRNIENSEWDLLNTVYNSIAKSPYIWDSSNRKFLAFENVQSISEKVQYANSNDIGGLMVWAIDQDDDADTLLTAVTAVNN